MTNVYVGFGSALKYWENRLLLQRSAAQRRQSVDGETLSSSLVADETVQRLSYPFASEAYVAGALSNDLEGLSAPVDVLVSSDASRGSSRMKRCHVWRSVLPACAFVRVGSAVYVSTPEFCFLQMARELSFSQLVCLGNRMCGLYGSPAVNDLAFKPMTSCDRIRAFLKGVVSTYGNYAARCAAQRLVDGFTSVRESAYSVALCIPERYGSCDLLTPVSNRSLRLCAAA